MYFKPVKELLFLPKAQNLVSKTLSNRRNATFNYLTPDRYRANPAKIFYKNVVLLPKLRLPTKLPTAYL